MQTQRVRVNRRRAAACIVGIIGAAGMYGSTAAYAGRGHKAPHARPVEIRRPADEDAKRFAVIGRWELMVDTGQGQFPSWLEITRSGYRTLVGRFVGGAGSARPIAQITNDNGQIRFAVPPQWEDRKTDLAFEGVFDGEKLRGTTNGPKGEAWTWTATRAPALKRDTPPHWGKPIALFNGKDMTGWEQRHPTDAKVGWTVKDGMLVNDRPGVDIKTTQKFTDFKLHTEFQYPRGSNSGLYLRGRYEVQIEDGYGQEPEAHGIGGVYGFLVPRINASKPAGEWQTCDVTLVGRTVTVTLNGETVIDRQQIPGITGQALDNDEAAPGPLLIQGDHGRITFRAVTLTPAL